MNTRILDKAITLAVEAHSSAERRGKDLPYIVHPLEAMTIVATMTNNQELLAAAVLHDVIEDSSINRDTIAKECGENVVLLVEHETHDNIQGWRKQRETSLERLKKASIEMKMVALGDKLSNLRAIASDVARQGDDCWKKFNAPHGKQDYAWYYGELAKSLNDLSQYAAYKEYLSLMNQIF